MEICAEISQHRIKHIISSYRLDEDSGDRLGLFMEYLNGLLALYPAPLVELALVETLIQTWSALPLQRGCSFLVYAHQLVRTWATTTIAPTMTPAQFQHITALDPTPIFTYCAQRSPQPPASQEAIHLL